MDVSYIFIALEIKNIYCIEM